MQYSASQPFHGDHLAAFYLAESVLTSLGFRSAQRTESTMEMLGPGMHSTRQTALLGATRITIARRSSDLSVEAELGGVAKMSRFVMLFPITLVLVLGVILTAVFWTVFGSGIWIWAVAGAIGVNGVTWLLIGPLMAKGMQTRTNRALDALLANMVAAARGQ